MKTYKKLKIEKLSDKTYDLYSYCGVSELKRSWYHIHNGTYEEVIILKKAFEEIGYILEN